GALRPTNKCHATLIRAQRGRSDAFLQQASEFPGRADFEVTSHFLDRRGNPSSKERKSRYSSPSTRLESGMYIVIALSGFCAMAGETVWTRILALLLGGSVYTFAIILAVFLLGLGLGSGIGSLLSRIVLRPAATLGYCQLLGAAAIAWTAYSLTASLPHWSVNPQTSSNIWFAFQTDLDLALRALLPPTLLCGASFPLALAAAANAKQDSGTLMARVYAANTIGAIVGVLVASLLLIARIGSQRIEQLLIAFATASGLLLLLTAFRATAIVGAGLAVLAAAVLINTVPPIPKVLIAHGRYAASWL